MKIYLSADNFEDLPAVDIERWYDRSERAWVIRFIDANGCQVGDAEYIGNGRAAADKVEAQMRETLQIKE
jgi:hypothetical protein